MILFRTTGHDAVSAFIGEEGPQARMFTVLPPGRARFSAWIARGLLSETRSRTGAGPGGTGGKRKMTQAEYEAAYERIYSAARDAGRNVEEATLIADRDTPRMTQDTREETS